MYSANCTAGKSVVSLEGTLASLGLQVPVSPASPENAINVCLLSDLVLSSDVLRTVAPRIAALEAAMMVKSLPVIPSNTSLRTEC